MGVCRYLARHGAHVIVTDLKTSDALSKSIIALHSYPNITFVLGGHSQIDLAHIDCVVKGPSARWDIPIVQDAHKAKIPVYMETALFVKHTPAIVVGVTGTRGKSTTAMLLYKVLKDYYKKGNVYLSGNVPNTCALELLDEASAQDVVVLELSSWQLSGFHQEKISPPYAVFTNFYEDHLNYYKDMQEYIYDKTAIFAYQSTTDALITLPSTLKILQDASFSIPSRILRCEVNDFSHPLLHLHGLHNKENAALAAKTASLLLDDVSSSDIQDHIASQSGMRFRQEIIAQKNELIVVNDSTSTTPIACIKAIETYKDKKLVLILGGNSKRLPTSELIQVMRRYRKQMVLIVLLPGTMTEEIVPQIVQIPNLNVSTIHTHFNDAVTQALNTALNCQGPTCLLFSPGATSFAQFTNEFDRGDKFNSLVSAIMK